MKPAPAGWVLGGSTIVAALALWGVLNFSTATEGMSTTAADVYRIADQQWRFQQVSAAVPAHGVIGYITDQTGLQAQAMLLGAQYVLAPRALVELKNRPDSPWVIGNFAKQLDVAEFGGEHGLQTVQDFGAGVVLFRKGTR
jgi:hypothetical protein